MAKHPTLTSSSFLSRTPSHPTAVPRSSSNLENTEKKRVKTRLKKLIMKRPPLQALQEKGLIKGEKCSQCCPLHVLVCHGEGGVFFLPLHGNPFLFTETQFHSSDCTGLLLASEITSNPQSELQLSCDDCQDISAFILRCCLVPKRMCAAIPFACSVRISLN